MNQDEFPPPFFYDLERKDKGSCIPPSPRRALPRSRSQLVSQPVGSASLPGGAIKKYHPQDSPSVLPGFRRASKCDIMPDELDLDQIEARTKALMVRKKEPEIIKPPVPIVQPKPVKKLPSNEDRVPVHVFGSHEAYYQFLIEMLALNHASSVGMKRPEPEYTMGFMHDIHDTMKDAQIKLNVYQNMTKGLMDSLLMDDFFKKVYTPEQYEDFKMKRGKALSKLLDPSYNPLKD